MTLAAGLVISASTAARAEPVEQVVQFSGRDDVPIIGTLALPAAAQPDHKTPAVVLIQGSGPTDRDGNQPPAFRTDLLRQIAGFLADAGIASLRFDKRGLYANRDTMPKSPQDAPRFFDWSAFVEDVHGAFDFLRARDAIDPERVGLFGHSEGGLLALDSATRHAPLPKVLVLASTPGRPLGDVIHDQLSRLLDIQHATAEQRTFFLDAAQRIQKEIVATGKVPNDVPPGLAALYPAYLGPFYQEVLPLDPIALAGRIARPMLVINGTDDTQVSATEDAGRFSSLFAGRDASNEVFLASGVSHNLKPVTDANPQGVTGDIDPRIKDAMLRWLKANF